MRTQTVEMRSKALRWFLILWLTGLAWVGSAWAQGPEAEPSVQTRPATTRTHTHSYSRSHQSHRNEPLRRDRELRLAMTVASLAYLFLLALPAYVGATSGYAAALVFEKDVRVGASTGAFRTTLMGALTAGAGLTCWAVVAALQSLDTAHGGLMAWLAGFIFLTLLVGAIVIVAFICAALAGVGAYLGAGFGPRAGGLLAALLSGLGLLAPRFILR